MAPPPILIRVKYNYSFEFILRKKTSNLLTKDFIRFAPFIAKQCLSNIKQLLIIIFKSCTFIAVNELN